MTHQANVLRRYVVALLRTIRLYGFAGWVYVALVAAFRPNHLSQPIVHLLRPLRCDTFGAMCFVVSGMAALIMTRLNP
jgi:hypothetical protein